MPPGRTRRKDDTWTTEELADSLKGPRGDPDRKKRSKDEEDRGERRRQRDSETNGRHRDEDKKSRHEEEERDRLRQERREKRGGDRDKDRDSKRKEDRKEKEDVDAGQREKRGESARRQRRRPDDEVGEKHRRDDGDKDRHKDRDNRHRDNKHRDKHRDEVNEDDDRERRQQERRERREKRDEDDTKEHRSKRTKDEDEGRKERHKDREDRKHRDREDRGDKGDKGDHRRDRDREERRRERDKERETREERDERKRREKEEREREKERIREEARRREEEDRRKKEEKEKANDYGDDGDGYDDDFEDYEDDFEDEEDLNDAMAYTLDYESPSRMGQFVQIEEGEMEEVLRALDEENARLTSHSHRSNWSDSTELSDERFKEGEEGQAAAVERERERESKPGARPRTVINFVSAKQRVLNQSVASKARRRANDLASMITMDVAHYDLFDLPPVREYDLYIRSFGRSNTRQAYVQTNEDACEREIQTEEIEDLDKWTQHPAEDLAGVGGEGITVMGIDSEETVVTKENLARVGKFIERAAQVVSVLLEEERGAEDGGSETRDRASTMAVSEGFSQLGYPLYLAGRHVERVAFCPSQPTAFLTLHSRRPNPSAENPIDVFGLICVWSSKEIAAPQKVLCSLSQPACACFSPSRAAVVTAGMHDGSVALWDLREPSFLHRSVYLGKDEDELEVVTRFPTYNTAGVLDKENHQSPVTAITAVHPTVLRSSSEESEAPASESEGGLSFQLASVEENAVLNLWVVTEIASPDLAGSEVDLGLAPGGRVKLLRSAAIALHNPNTLASNGSVRALDVTLNPSDLNHFFVATDLGHVIHGVRFGSRVFPRLYQPEIASPKKVTCIEFSPFGKPYFLMGCEDGSVSLFHTSLRHPLSSWSAFSEGSAIVSVQWSRSRPVVFLVLTEDSRLFTFDLVQTGLMPVAADTLNTGRVTSLAVASDPALIGGNKSLPAHMLVALDTGDVELHTVGAEWRKQQPLEVEFLHHYMERF